MIAGSLDNGLGENAIARGKVANAQVIVIARRRYTTGMTGFRVGVSINLCKIAYIEDPLHLHLLWSVPTAGLELPHVSRSRPT
jgi:hypothetical protein